MTHRFAQTDIDVKVSLSKWFDVGNSCLLRLLNIWCYIYVYQKFVIANAEEQQQRQKNNTMTDMCESLYLACGIDNFFLSFKFVFL